MKCTKRRSKFSSSAFLENNERGTKLELWAERNVIFNGPNKIRKDEIGYFLIHKTKKASFVDTKIKRRFNVRSNHESLLLNVHFGKLDTKQYSARRKTRIFSSDELSQDVINIFLLKMLLKRTKRPDIITNEISGLIKTRLYIFQNKSITNLFKYTNLNKLFNYKIRNEKKKRDQAIFI
uniref:Ribosomal protein S18 n=1 Tax=Strongyloides venezuelensis TaxID=75913 RepID=A0A0K0FD53_STRVS